MSGATFGVSIAMFAAKRYRVLQWTRQINCSLKGLMMLSSTIQKSEPSITEHEAKEFLAAYWAKMQQPAIQEPLVYCSWPERFSSTSGPFGGIGGHSHTLFRMEAWVGVYTNTAVVFCGGKMVHVGELSIAVQII